MSIILLYHTFLIDLLSILAKLGKGIALVVRIVTQISNAISNFNKKPKDGICQLSLFKKVNLLGNYFKFFIFGLSVFVIGSREAYGATITFVGLGGGTTYCCPTTITAQITAGGMGTNNSSPLVFTIELSNLGGSFPATPNILATFSTTNEHWYSPATYGSITGTVQCSYSPGSYKVRVHVTGGDHSENTYSNVSLDITIGVSTNAGPDQAICSGGTATLAGVVTGATSVIWSGGSGSYVPNSTTLNTVYTPTAAEILTGSVTLTLSTVGGICGSGQDQMTIIINQIPVINTVTSASRCGTGTLTLGATASAGTINWYTTSTGGLSIASGTSFTTPSLTTTTTYYVDATNNGCTSATRTSVVATVAGASDLWIGGTSGALTDWNTASNWSCGVPTATTDVTIPSGLTYYPVIGATNGICRTITDMGGGSITGTGSLTIAGNTGVAITNISGTAAISSPIIMPSSASITVAGTLTVSGLISGASTSITKSGAGILTFSGANSFAGTTTVSAGTLNIQNANALGTTTGGTIVISGATLEMQGGISVGTESLTLAGDGVGGQSGGALFNVNGNNSWGGTITLNGTTRINSNAGTLSIPNTVNLSGNNLLIQGASTGANTISGVISGTGYVNKVGGGVWTLSGANTFSGGVLLYNGTLNINNSQALGSIAGGFTIGGVGNTVTIDNTSGSAITTLNYPMAWNDNFTFTGTNALNLGTGAVTLQETRQVTVAANTLTVGGIISGSGLGLTKLGSGMLTLTGNNSYSGSTTITAGELRLNPSVNSTPGSQFILNSGILSTTNITSGRTINSSTTLQLNDNSTLNLGSAGHNLSFANSSGTTWSAGKILTISGWQGSWNGTTGTAGKIFMGSLTGLNTYQLAQIRFFNGTKYFSAILLPGGELVPAEDYITTLAISGSTFCAGSSFSMPFTYSYASNFTSATTFTAQLSDASGSFTSPVVLGTIAGNAMGNQIITATIPMTTLSGTAYQIRVVSDTPAITGTVSVSILTINGTPVIPAQTAIICSGTSPNFAPSNSPPTTIVPQGTTYTWTAPSINPLGAITGGSAQSTGQLAINQVLINTTTSAATATYNVTPTAGSCPGAQFTLTVPVNTLPSVAGTLSVCVGSTTQLTGSGTPALTNPWISGSTGVATITSTGLVTGVSAGTSLITYTDSNDCSINTTFTINAPPVITTQPTNELDCEGHIVSFNVSVTGSGLTYIWQRKKPSGSFSDIPVEANVSYPTPGTIRLQNVGNSDAPDGTQYRVVITNSNNCSITSNAATLTVNEIIGIAPTATSVTICQGNNYSYAVSTSYPANVVSYQWKKWNNPGQWDNVVDGGAVTGATTNHLIFTGATPSESGKYKVTVVFHSSGADCNVTSDTRDRELIVNPLSTSIPGGPDSRCQSTTPSPITLTGSSIGGSATSGEWSITNLTPDNGGVNGSLSPTGPTASPETVTYTPPANYTGEVTLTLTSNGPCGSVIATRTITINPLPTTSPIYHR